MKIIFTLISLISLSAFANCQLPDALPYQQGWLGGDVGTSLLLPDGRSFWIFGDSFVGKTRREAEFISNTVGISNCSDESFKIEYFWKFYDNRPAPFFKRKKDESYWPLSTFMIDDYLFINLLRIKYVKNAIGFEQHGVDLARISNWQSHPSLWKIDYIELSDRSDIFPVTETVLDDEYAYIYSYRQLNFGEQETLVARVKRSDLISKNDLKSHIQYLHMDHSYATVSDPGLLKIILNRGNTELSLKKIGEEWWLIQMNRRRLNQILSQNSKIIPDQIILQRSKHFLGPWSAPETLYEVPETTQDHKLFSAGNFCYAAKAHTQFMSDHFPVSITYVCNTLLGELIYDQPEIYRPVKAPMQPSSH